MSSAPGEAGAKTLEDTTLFVLDRSGAGIYKSSDGGGSWSSSHDGLEDRAIQDLAVSASQPETLYAASFNQFSKSTDGGETWTADIGDMTPFTDTSAPIIQRLAVHPTNPDVLIAGNFSLTFGDLGVGTFFRSTDGGGTWEEVYRQPGPPDVFKVSRPSSIAFDPEDPNLIFAGVLEVGETVSGRVLRSDDGGTTWSEVLTDVGLPQVSFAPGVVYVTASRSSGLSSGVFKSTDRGLSWAAMTSGLPAPVATRVDNGLSIDPGDGDFLQVIVSGNPYFSDDAAARWQAFDVTGLNLDAVRLFSLSAVRTDSEITMFAGFNGGVFAYTGGGCVNDLTTLCIDRRSGDRRFQVDLAFDTQLGGGRSGDAEPTPLGSLGITDGGILSFFDSNNPEVLIKVLDGCSFNDRFWVFYAATTSAGFDLTVEDTFAGASKVYTNPDLMAADTVTDTSAFATCAVAAGAVPGETSSWPELGEPPAQVRQAAVDGDGPQGPCVSDANTLCIDDRPGDSRFAITLDFDTTLGGGLSGAAEAKSLASLGISRGGILSFFDSTNPEVLIKILNGCGFNNRYWVFYAASTTVGFELTVRDTETGVTKTYVNPDLTAAQTITDTSALDTCL